MAFVKKRLDEEKLTSKARLNTVNFGDKVMLGPVVSNSCASRTVSPTPQRLRSIRRMENTAHRRL